MRVISHSSDRPKLSIFGLPMGSATDIVEISSDEEENSGWNPASDWLDEFFNDIDDPAETEGLDDVVVVSDRSSPTAAARKRGTSRDGSDDDCLVLDGDPDKPVAVMDDKGGGGSDDLLVVGEKGQIACRDYPHPRHLCATFPFSTTPHEKHCNLCHCYVCDSPAPCIYWCNGVPSANHCHSTDKEGSWKFLRKSFRQKNTATPSMMPPVQKPVQHSLPTSLPTHSSRPSILRPCPATIATSRNPVNQRHFVKYQSQRLLSQHQTRPRPLTSGIPHVQREKRGAGALPAQIMQSHQKSRRVGATANNPSSRNTNCSQFAVSSRNKVYRAELQRLQCPPATLVENTNCSQFAVSNRDKVYRAEPQKVQFPPPALVEENMKRWQDVLEGVAAELGVSVNSDRGNSSHQSQQSSAPPPTNSSSLGYDYGWLNSNTTEQINDVHGRLEDPQPVTVHPSNSSVSGELQMDSVLASVELGALPEAGKEPVFPGLDPDPEALLFDFESSWSSIPNV